MTTPPLTITDVFTPAPSGVGGQPGTAPPSGSWLANLLGISTTLQLAVTAWQPGAVVRTVYAVMATLFAAEDGVISQIAQGGFLDFAATGTTTFTNPLNGNVTIAPVTPDPSIPSQNPTGAPGWLDILADSMFNVQRIQAAFASNLLLLANTSGSTYGPFSAGTYHVANPSNALTYSNSATLTIPPSTEIGTAVTGASNTTPITISTQTAHGLATGAAVYTEDVGGNANANGFFFVTVTSPTTFSLNGSSGSGAWSSGGAVFTPSATTFQADGLGTQYSAAPGQITAPVTALIGLACGNLLPFVGSNYESNSALAARCRLKQQALSPNGPAGAYQYVALTSSQLLAALTPPVTLDGGPITRVEVLTTAGSGEVVTVIANAGGPVEGVAQLAITGATNASPIVLAFTSPHGLATNDYGTVQGVDGNASANGTWQVTVVDSTHVSLNGSTGSGTYTGGGTIEGGDLGQVDRLIQALVVPSGVGALTVSATTTVVNIVATVYVPAAFASQYAAAYGPYLATLFSTFPIGGEAVDGSANVLPYSAVEEALFAAGEVNGAASYVQSVSPMTLNGSTSDVALSSIGVPQLGTVSLNVVSV